MNHEERNPVPKNLETLSFFVSFLENNESLIVY